MTFVSWSSKELPTRAIDYQSYLPYLYQKVAPKPFGPVEGLPTAEELRAWKRQMSQVLGLLSCCHHKFDLESCCRHLCPAGHRAALPIDSCLNEPLI